MADIATCAVGGRVSGKNGKKEFSGVITKILSKSGELVVKTADGEKITIAAEKVTKARGRPPAEGAAKSPAKAAPKAKITKNNGKTKAEKPVKSSAKKKSKADERDSVDDMLEMIISVIRVAGPQMVQDALNTFLEDESEADEKPAAKRGRPAAKSKGKKKDDENYEDEDEDEEDEDED